MDFKFDSPAVKGALSVEPAVKVLDDETANAALLIICAFSRRIPLLQVADAIRHMLRAESVGPILHPEAWMHKDAFRLHSANLDILRRFEDFRRAIIEADEVNGVDPHFFEVVQQTDQTKAG